MPPGPKKGPNKDSLKWIVDKHMLTRREVTKIFSGYHRFLFQERPLVREEIFGIVAIMLGKKTVSPLTPNVLNGMLDIFDDPNHPYTIEHAKLYEEDAPNLDTAVDESYQTLCEDPLAIDRRAILNGL